MTLLIIKDYGSEYSSFVIKLFKNIPTDFTDIGADVERR